MERRVGMIEAFIEQNDGLEDEVSENATNLSTGQKQRISLVRASLQSPSVLILDEALSNIDEDNFRQITRNLGELNCSIIYITHSPDWIEKYDSMYEIQGSKIQLKN